MSDKDTGAPATNGAAPHFTERELQMLGWAMQSLKTGPPEIDYAKLAAFAGMSNPRSASNAWAKIKSKLSTSVPEDGSPAPTPKKAGGGRKKAAAATPAADDGDEGAAPATPKPKATPRKRAAKKQDVEGEDASPKKKGRPAKTPLSEETVKAEPEENDDVKIEHAPAEEMSLEEEV